MTSIRITLSDESRAHIQRMGRLGRQIRPVIRQAAATAAELLAAEIKAKELTGQTLKVVTDMLRTSVAGRVIDRGGNILVAVGVIKGPAMKYASIHEFGGTIRAKPGGALAVPLPTAKTEGGRSLTPKTAKTKYPDMFLLKRRGRPPLLCYPLRVAGKGKNAGKVKRLVPLFVLLKSVKIPARHWLSEGVRKHQNILHVQLERNLNALLGSV